ncbi:hypothetical protein GCM10027294_09530 [Marinactinospora endophytica]
MVDRRKLGERGRDRGGGGGAGADNGTGVTGAVHREVHRGLRRGVATALQEAAVQGEDRAVGGLGAVGGDTGRGHHDELAGADADGRGLARDRAVTGETADGEADIPAVLFQQHGSSKGIGACGQQEAGGPGGGRPRSKAYLNYVNRPGPSPGSPLPSLWAAGLDRCRAWGWSRIARVRVVFGRVWPAGQEVADTGGGGAYPVTLGVMA